MPKVENVLAPVSNYLERFIEKNPLAVGFIVMYQGLFAGNAIKIPKRLEVLFKSKIFRFISIVFVAFTGTLDIEWAIIDAFMFLLFLYILKTPEEREKQGFI